MTTTKALIKNLKDQDWYKALLEEINATIVETITLSREAVLQGKWLVGKLIEDAVQDFNRANIYGAKINALLARDLRWSEREISRCRKFYKKFPADSWDKALRKLPGGKELSWHKMVVQYLPDNPTDGKDDKHYISVLVDDTAQEIYIREKYKHYKIKYFT